MVGTKYDMMEMSSVPAREQLLRDTVTLALPQQDLPTTKGLHHSRCIKLNRDLSPKTEQRYVDHVADA